jgi:5-formyltetrahydrofolate cyclo-ligase
MNINNNIDSQKKLLRKSIKELKKSVGIGKTIADSEQIFIQIESLPEFKLAKTVLAYWSLPGEVHTHDFVMKWYQKKQILLPLVVGEDLELREFSGMDCMEVGPAFGILEPRKGNIANDINIDFAITPGLAFDNNGNRLGRGKGYYDKLFKNKNIYKVGVCFNFQIISMVPTEEYDVPMDKIIHV